MLFSCSPIVLCVHSVHTAGCMFFHFCITMSISSDPIPSDAKGTHSHAHAHIHRCTHAHMHTCTHVHAHMHTCVVYVYLICWFMCSVCPPYMLGRVQCMSTLYDGSCSMYVCMLVAGCWLLVAGCWLLAAGCLWLVAGAGCWLLVDG